MLLNAEKAAFFPLPLVLVARSGRRLRGCGLVAATGAAAAARLGVDMDSDHRVGVVIPSGFGDNSRHSIVVDVDDVSGASVFGGVTGHDVTVGAARKSSLQSALQDAVFVVESDESAIAARKGDLIVAVVPPVSDAFHAGGVSPCDHVPDLAPSVLADPVVAAGAVALDGHIVNAAIAVGGRTNPIVAACDSARICVGAHNFGESVRESHHESVGDLVSSWFPVSDDRATTAMAALVVVIVDENPGIVRFQHSPRRTEAPEVLELVVSSAQLTHENSKFEFGHASIAHVLALLDRLASHINHFLVNEKSGSRSEPMLSVQVVRHAQNSADVSGPHVLGGVDADSGHAQ